MWIAASSVSRSSGSASSVATLTKPVSPARLLDVGCGTGWFLEVEMQEGLLGGLEMGKEIPGADHSVVAMESLATSALRNARLATLSSHSLGGD